MLLARLCGKSDINLGEFFTSCLPHIGLIFFSSNHVPWAILTACFVVSAVLILVLRFMLVFENKRRNVGQRDETYDSVYLTHVGADGTRTEKKVDRVCARFRRSLLVLNMPHRPSST